MNIVGFVMVGTNDLEKSREFYDAVLVHLELRKVTITERYIGYGHSDDDLAVKFYITKPYDKNKNDIPLLKRALQRDGGKKEENIVYNLESEEDFPSLGC